MCENNKLKREELLIHEEEDADEYTGLYVWEYQHPLDGWTSCSRMDTKKFERQHLLGLNRIQNIDIPFKKETKRSVPLRRRLKMLEDGKSSMSNRPICHNAQKFLFCRSTNEADSMVELLLKWIEEAGCVCCCNPGILYPTYKLNRGNFWVNKMDVSLVHIALIWIQKFPQSMRGYALLCTIPGNQEQFELINNERTTLSRQQAYEYAWKYASLTDATAWAILAGCKLPTHKDDKKLLCLQNAFELSGGYHRVHPNMAYFGDPLSPNARAVHYAKVIDVLMPFVTRENIAGYYSFCFDRELGSWYAGVDLWRMLIDSVCEFRGLLKKYPLLEIPSMKILSNVTADSLKELAEGLELPLMGHRMYNISGTDSKGEKAWYFLLLNVGAGDLESIINAGETFNLEDYGKIVESGFGDRIPDYVLHNCREKLKIVIPTSLDPSSIHQLRGWLRHSNPTVTFENAMMFLTFVDTRGYNNIERLSKETMEYIVEKVKSDAMKVDLPEWSNETHSSLKYALIAYSSFSQVRDLVNFGFQNGMPYVDSDKLLYYRPMVTLICSALSALPRPAKLYKAMYTSVVVGRNAQLTKYVESPSECFAAGKIVSIPWLSSASIEKERALNGSDGHLLFHVKNTIVYDIRSFNYPDAETELPVQYLLHPPTMLLVKSWKQTGSLITVEAAFCKKFALSYTEKSPSEKLNG